MNCFRGIAASPAAELIVLFGEEFAIFPRPACAEASAGKAFVFPR